jgi:hypothetical protein
MVVCLRKTLAFATNFTRRSFDTPPPTRREKSQLLTCNTTAARVLLHKVALLYVMMMSVDRLTDR